MQHATRGSPLRSSRWASCDARCSSSSASVKPGSSVRPGGRRPSRCPSAAAVNGSSTGTHTATRSPNVSATRSTWRGQVRRSPTGSWKPRSSSENQPGRGPSSSTAHTSMPSARAARSTSVTSPAKPVSHLPGPRFEPRPVDGPPQRAHAHLGQQREVRRGLDAELAAGGRGRQAALRLPTTPVAAGGHAERSRGGGGDAPADEPGPLGGSARFEGHVRSIPGTVPPWGRPIASGTPAGTASQVGFDLDATDVFSEITDDLLYHGDLNAALRRMMQSGFDDPNGERLQGMREMLEKLRQKRREALENHDLGGVYDDIAQELRDVVEQERVGDRRAGPGGARLGRRPPPGAHRRGRRRAPRRARPAPARPGRTWSASCRTTTSPPSEAREQLRGAGRASCASSSCSSTSTRWPGPSRT